MAAELDDIVKQAQRDIIQTATTTDLRQIAAKYMGKQGLLSQQRKNIRALSSEERPVVGARIQAALKLLEDSLAAKQDALDAARLEQTLAEEGLDVTLAGRRQSVGSLHPVTQTIRQIEDIFTAAGYQVATGPEIEDDYHNFTALNLPEHHPARAMHDTLYVDSYAGSPDNLKPLLLRTHTSPAQIRVMESQAPPIQIICPGRVYRADDPDASHTPMFHQIEGLVVAEGISMAHLKGTVLSFLQAFFETSVEARFRPSYFPFTEPSAEVDVQCTHCWGQGCQACSRTGWVEVMGCGMVHPKVLEMMDIDSEQFSAFAFGFGADRLCALRYGIDDVRVFFNNHLHFLRQFCH